MRVDSKNIERNNFFNWLSSISEFSTEIVSDWYTFSFLGQHQAITYLDLKHAVAAPPRLVFLYWSTHSLSHTHSKESLLSASLCISAHIESNVSEKTISSLTSISVSYGTRQLWAAKILSQALIHNNNELVAYDDDDYVPSTTKTLWHETSTGNCHWRECAITL